MISSRPFLILIPLLILIACSQTQDPSELSPNPITVSGMEVVIDTETSDSFAMPGRMVHTGEKLIVTDPASGLIHRFDAEYNLTESFGSQGSGPGEYGAASGLWSLDGELHLYDPQLAKLLRYTPEGEFTGERVLDGDSYAHQITLKSADEIYSPTAGREGSLIFYSNQESGEGAYFGEARADEEELSISSARQAVERGQVPGFMKNQVSLAANSERLFSFQQTTGKLQVFSHDRELLWEYQIELDFMDEVFENFLEANTMMLDQGNIILLAYASDMAATDNGVAILFQTPMEHPAVIGWFDNDAVEFSLITYGDVVSGNLMFALAAEQSSVYFGNILDGEIYKADLPL